MDKDERIKELETNAPVIANILQEYCNKGFIKEIDYLKYGLKECFFHKIFKYIL